MRRALGLVNAMLVKPNEELIAMELMLMLIAIVLLGFLTNTSAASVSDEARLDDRELAWIGISFN